MEQQILEMKKKAIDIHQMIEKCNNLMNHIETFTNELQKRKIKKDNLEENPKNLEPDEKN
jgi:hypothetical protein